MTSEATDLRNIDQALAELGVTVDSLTSVERQALNDLGFVVLKDVFPTDRLDQYRELFDRAVKEQLPPGSSYQKETGTRHIKDLHLIEPLWRASMHPRILAAVYHVLNRRFVCGVPHGREPLPGFGEQGL